MSTLELHLLGKPQVRRGGEPVHGFHSNKVRALLFYVAVRGQPEARAKLAGLFWGDLPEENANANLRKSLTNLRRLAGSHLTITRSGVGIDQANPPWVDVQEFEAGLDSGDPTRLERALDSYHGAFLDGFYLRGAEAFERWQLAERRRLQERLLSGLKRLAQYEADRRRYAAAIRRLQRLLALEPLREDMQRLLITLYWQNGQQARALKQFEAYRALLAAELSVAPSAETRKLVREIRAGTRERGRQAVSGSEGQPVVPHPSFLKAGGKGRKEPGVERSDFVGREPQLAQLEQELAAAIEGEFRVAFVTGEAGYGKSALLHEFSRRAGQRHPRLILASGRCNAFSGRGDPFHPFREALALLGGDVEGPRRPAAPTFREVVKAQGSAHLPGEQILSQFTAALGRVAEQHPLLLVLDDLQWADNASLDLLFHLSRALSRQPIFILGAYRPSDAALTAEAAAQPPLLQLVTEFERRFGPVRVDLGWRSEPAARDFVDKLIDREPNRLGERFRHAFFRRTQGHPLFCGELLREMQARGEVRRDETGRWEATSGLQWEHLPARVDAVVTQRFARVDAELREILAVASVEGESFTAQVLARVLERDERALLQQLDRLQKTHRLVRETAEVEVGGRWLARYQFDHILFQQHQYEELNQGERRLLHAQVAAALEALYPVPETTAPVALAHHYLEANRQEKAIFYLLAAGDRARSQNAHREALEHYERALNLMKKKGDHESAARTLMKIGLTHHNASTFEQARRANREAFWLWQQVRPARIGMLPPAPHPLRIAGEMFSGKLDPAMVKETPRALLVQQLFSGLMRLGHDLELLPDIAQGWDVYEGGRRYVFYLRQDVRWSDGQPLTAADFEYAWKRVLDPATGSPNAVDLFDVKGAHDFHLGQAEAAAVGIRALDAHTLQVELAQVSPYFPNLLFVESTKPVPRHIVETHGSDWTEPEKIVTNGPFRLVSLQPNQSVFMARYADYHGPFSGNVEQVEVQLGLGEERLRHLEMYLDDELDVLYTFSHLPPETQAQLREALIGEYRSGPLLATWLVGFVLSRPPFDDVRVRRALAMAVDRDLLANVVNRGLVLPASGGFLSPVHAAYSDGIALPYDPDRARRLLAAAGYAGGRGLPPITMVNGHASLSVGANLRYLQEQWREQLGVNLRWETIWDMDAFLRRLRQDPPHLFFIRWAGKHTDPDDFLYLESSLVWEIARWHDPEYFALVKRARRLADWSERMALYRQADRKLIEEAVVLPLAYDRSHFLIKPWIRGWASAAIQRWFFTEVYLEPH